MREHMAVSLASGMAVWISGGSGRATLYGPRQEGSRKLHPNGNTNDGRSGFGVGRTLSLCKRRTWLMRRGIAFRRVTGAVAVHGPISYPALFDRILVEPFQRVALWNRDWASVTWTSGA